MRYQLKTVVAKYRRGLRFRYEALLYINLTVNIGYALFSSIRGIVMHSIWLGTLAFYYIILSIIRFTLMHGYKQDDNKKRWKKYRISAIIMMILTFVLIGIHCITIYMNYTITYPGYMIYAMATYTFYAVISAIRNIIICRKYNNPILSASVALNLAVAAISVYSLQSAMISAFGNNRNFKIIMGNCVGTAVFMIIVSISVTMVVKSTKKLKHD